MKEIVRKSVYATAAVVGIFAFLLMVGLAGGIDTGNADPEATYPAMYIAVGFMAVCLLIVNALKDKEK